MQDPEVTELVAFDRQGIQCGLAHRDADGVWKVTVRQMTTDGHYYHCDTEQAAWNFLSAYGAATVKPSDGWK